MSEVQKGRQCRPKKMKETGKLPEEAAKDVVGMYEERGRLQEGIAESKQCRIEERDSFETAGRETNEYVKAGDALEGVGLEPGDLNELSNLLSNHQVPGGVQF